MGLTVPKLIKEQNIDQTYKVEIIGKVPYNLSSEEYQILIKTENWSLRWSNNLLIFAVLLLFFPLGAKFLYNLFSQQHITILIWEKYAPILPFVIALILKWISHCWPDERTKLLKDIGKFFKSQPKTSGYMKK